MTFSLSSFKALLEVQNVMHGNRYICNIGVPSGFNSTVGSIYQETLTFRAEGVVVPGMTLASADGIPGRLGYGPSEGVPYGIVHDDITVTFGADDVGLVHKFFYDWLDLIVAHKAYGQRPGSLNRTTGSSAYEVQYKDTYSSDIDIYILAPQHNEARYTTEHVIHVKMYRAYPKLLPGINLAYGEKNNYVRLPVQFNYTDFVVNHKKLNTQDTIANPT